MKQTLPSRCALALFIMVPAWPLCAESQASPGDGSRYQHFMVYPHRQAGYAAMRVGDERTAIAEFTRARELAPQSVDTALDLAEAYRHFGHAAQAQTVLNEQMRYTPNDSRLRAAMTPPASPAVDCNRDNRPVCRAKRGFGDLQTGDLARAQAELDAPDFAASPEGRRLRHALVQRAIYIGDDQRAVTQLAELDAHDKLSSDERNQWFMLLLKLGKLDAAQQLQSRGGLDAPTQQLSMAQAMGSSGDRKLLASYMAVHQPTFANAKDERQWINLLAMAGRIQPALLDHYTVRFPANAAWQARAALPLAMMRGDLTVAGSMLSRLPADGFHEERFSLDLQQGRYAEAQQQAEMLIAQPDGYRLLDPLSYRLMEAGALHGAKQLLLDAYPFTGNTHSAALWARLAVLAGEQPALFSADDRIRLRRPLDSVTLRVAQLQILGALRDCDGIHQVMADLSPDYPAELWRQLGDCYGKDRPGLAEYAYAQAGKRKPSMDTTRALAYQAYSAQDYETALLAWRSVPAAHMGQADLIAAATTALTIHETAVASAWLDTYAAQGGKQDGTYWWLRAQADEPHDPVLASTDLENAVDVQPDPRYYARLAALQAQAGDAQQALASWQHASALAPDDGGLAASLGYAYLQAGEPQKALVSFERAHQADPDNPALTRQLLYVNQRLGDYARARFYDEQAIDQFGAVDPDGTSSDTKQDQDALYSLRRLHENLGRTWSFNADMSLGDTVSSAANTVAPGVSYRSYAQWEAQYHLDPQLTGGDLNTLTAYARLFAGSGVSGAVWPVHEAMLGIGVHWKPLISQNIVLSVEQQTPADNSRDTHNDTLLRASGSWSFGPKLSDDWHASGWGWPAQNFYVDIAHYLRAKESVVTLDYRFGLHDKIASGQTIEPYIHLQYTGIDRSQGLTYLRDGRAGLGVQWNVWYGETHYDAYPHRFSVAVEGQHAFTTYLRDRNAVFLIVRTQW
ncbi:NfrA family protein [Dyella nitratireducens]|uniref:Phage receptor n=1 Tax=Dyella nitratireducens TaxID=1849580 RepID=A0ABQ1G6M1_9GAMM|nr:tetratricopeptide repeat protein [Dyella nitratireducens]GGA37783.1 phage receptor [Dyella nitratireducens]GLQ40226.1 phage receptor [Dyella nitratireducens]